MWGGGWPVPLSTSSPRIPPPPGPPESFWSLRPRGTRLRLPCWIWALVASLALALRWKDCALELQPHTFPSLTFRHLPDPSYLRGPTLASPRTRCALLRCLFPCRLLSSFLLPHLAGDIGRRGCVARDLPSLCLMNLVPRGEGKEHWRNWEVEASLKGVPDYCVGDLGQLF